MRSFRFDWTATMESIQGMEHHRDRSRVQAYRQLCPNKSYQLRRRDLEIIPSNRKSI